MLYIRAWGSNGYCGCDWEDYFTVEDDTEIIVIENMVICMSEEWAESYEYVATGWDDDFETEEDRMDYYDNLDYGWEFITEQEYEEVNS